MEMFTYEVLEIIPVLGTTFTKALKCFSDNAIDITLCGAYYVNKKIKKYI